MLWLFGEDRQITEVGSSNFVAVLEKEDGSGAELITAPLSRGDILPGVTRDSVLVSSFTRHQRSLMACDH